MSVLVVFALEWEFGPWQRMRPFRRLDGPADVYEARIGDARIVVAFAGIGARHIANLASLFTPDVVACICAGLGGGLVPHLRVGDVVAAQQVRTVDGGRAVAADGGLVSLAEVCGARTVGRFLSSTRVVTTADEKRRMGSDGEVVEMEGAVVLGAAADRGVPAIAIRVVGDGSDETLPLDFNRVLGPNGDVGLARVIGLLCRRPWTIPTLIRFGARNRAATERLAVFLDRYVQRLASGSGRPW